MCVTCIDLSSTSTIFRWYCGTVPVVWYFVVTKCYTENEVGVMNKGKETFVLNVPQTSTPSKLLLLSRCCKMSINSQERDIFQTRDIYSSSPTDELRIWVVPYRGIAPLSEEHVLYPISISHGNHKHHHHFFLNKLLLIA